MRDKLRRLGTETAIYGLSTIVGRFLTFLLTPLYANILLPGELGIVATVFSYVAFLNVVYHYGMDTAYMKYVSLPASGDRREVFTAPFVSVTLSSFVLSALIVLFQTPLAGVLHLAGPQIRIIPYAALILLLDAMALVPFAVLRMDHKAGLFASAKLFGIVVNVLCTILFLVTYSMGMEGIFLAGVISSGLTLLFLAPSIIANIRPRIRGSLLSAMVTYGWPTVPAGLAAMAIQVIDRPILEALTDSATVGIYQANYRLGIFMMLVVSMVDFAWRPFMFGHAHDSDAKQLFARVLTYFVFLMSCIFVVLLLFLDDAVKSPFFFGYSILPSTYWEGLAIVPVVMIGYMFLGMSNIFSAGLFIEKKTGKLPLVTFAGAATNILANVLLIPLWGMMGAAIATLVSYGVMAGFMYALGAKAYPVPFEFTRLGKILLAMGVVGLLSTFVPSGALWKVLLAGLFPLSMYWLRVFSPAEAATLRTLFRRSGSIPPEGERGDNPDGIS